MKFINIQKYLIKKRVIKKENNISDLPLCRKAQERVKECKPAGRGQK